VPEGDTVFLAATRLDTALAGQTLTRTDFRVPRIATVDLAGRTVERVVSHGKHLLFRIAGGVTLHTHFKLFEANRTTGSQITTGDRRPGHTHWVYGRAGRPCRRCGTPIRVRGPREPERVTYWCPACQPV
jgi:formamidopyrimidine-DNA glycosylase